MTDTRSKNELKTIRCGISHAFDEKTLKPGFTEKAYGDSFNTVETDLRALAKHVITGGAWIPGQFEGATRKNDTFICTQVIALDYDENLGVRDLIAVRFVRKHAFLIHPTKSSTAECFKTRVAFVLDAPIHGVEATRALIRAIADYIGLPHDAASYKPAQPYFGSKNPIEIPHIDPRAVLPLALATNLMIDHAQADYERHQDAQERLKDRKPVDLNSTRAEKYAAATYDGIMRDVYTLRVGNKANEGLFHYCKQLFAIAHWPGISESKIESDVEPIYSAWPNVRKSRGTVANARRWGRANPREMVLDEKPAPTSVVQKTDVKPAPDVETVEHVLDALTCEQIRAIKNLVIIGGVGLGKTYTAKQYAASLPDETFVTGIAQYKLLVDALCRELNLHHYKESSSEYQSALRVLARLGSSISSLHKFPDRESGVVILDEVEGDLQFILNSKTFKNDEALVAWRALKSILQNAQQVIAMDANTSDITLDLFRRWLGDLTIKRYRRAGQPRPVQLLANNAAALYQIGKLLSHGRGKVYAGIASEKTATRATDWYRALGYRVLKITSDTSHTAEVRAFHENQHGEREQYDLIVYDSAAGAGVDFATPIYAQVCIFDRDPLAPEQAIQLFGRVRHAQKYYAAVPADSEGYKTDSADELLATWIQNECYTAQRNGREAQVTGDYLEMAQVSAAFKARFLKEKSQWRRAFIQRLESNGFRAQVNNARAPIAFSDQWEAWLMERDAREDQDILLAIGQAVSNEQMDKYRMSGREIDYNLKIGNTRYKIEQSLGHEHVTINDLDLKQYMGRKRLSFLEDVHTDESDLLLSDAEQAAAGVPVHQRKHKAKRMKAAAALLSMIGFNGATILDQMNEATQWALIEHDEHEIAERCAPWMTYNAWVQLKALGHQGNNAKTPAGRLRWFFKLFGIETDSHRHGRAENRYMSYQLNAETTAYRMERARRAAELHKAAKMYQKCTIQERNTFLVHTQHAPASPRPEAQKAWGLPTNSTGASRANPFSRAVA